jgi:phosphatidylglycerol:prolipoprotein diacylglycerol transferase
VIPYFNLPVPKIGPLEIHAFGVLVATGILLGSQRVQYRGRQLGLSDELTSSLATWVVVGGFIVAHIFDVLAYSPAEFLQDPTILFKVWRGISSFGGFLGALIAMLIWQRRHGVRLLVLSDALLYGLATGWFFGRLGCFTAHDHPGRYTDFFLAVRYPDGPKHDLGLEEALFTGALMVLFLVLSRKRRRPARIGLYAALATITYGPVRFALDFLRVEGTSGADPRYFGLTPAQYGCIAVFLVGAVLLAKILRNPEYATPAPPATQAKPATSR